jgi:tetratricopeptide (TPR) repeat protein
MLDWFRKIALIGDAEQSPIQTGDNNEIRTVMSSSVTDGVVNFGNGVTIHNRHDIPPAMYQEAVNRLCGLEADKARLEMIIESLLIILGKSDTPREKWNTVLLQMATHYCTLANTLESVESFAEHQQEAKLIQLTFTSREYLRHCQYGKLQASVIAVAKYAKLNKATLYYRTVAIEANNALASLNRLLLDRIAADGYSYQAEELLLESNGYEEIVMRYLQEASDHFEAKGQYREAILLFERLLVIAKSFFAPQSVKLAYYFHYMGRLYRKQGQYDESLNFFQHALAIREKHLGENHLDTANTLNSLGVLYDLLGHYEESMYFDLRALAIKEKVLGEQHPTVATSLNNLAYLYNAQGRTKEALPLYQRALAIWEKTLGENHPNVASSLNNLANLYYAQGHYEEALPLYQRALAIRKNVLGEQHPDVATSLNSLAYLYESQGRTEEALPLYQRALAILEKSLGTEHPHTKIVAENYADLQAKMASFEHAQRLQDGQD